MCVYAYMCLCMLCKALVISVLAQVLVASSVGMCKTMLKQNKYNKYNKYLEGFKQRKANKLGSQQGMVVTLMINRVTTP